MYEIYKITNSITGRSYIGITKRTAVKRLAVHLSEARRAIYGMYLHRSMRKHGPQAFRVEVLERADSHSAACLREIELIRAHGTREPLGYNEHAGGSGGCAEASDAYRAKLSASMIGRIAHNKGKPTSPETRMKMSLAKKGRKFTSEHVAAVQAGKLAAKQRRAAMTVG